MSGTLSIPNVIATQPGPTFPASLEDQNWNATRDYINAREITVGTLGARPAPSTEHAFYFATDTSTLYVVQGGAGVVIGVVTGGAPGSRNLRGQTASGTTFSYSADYVVLRSPTDGSTIVRINTGTLTNDITIASAANGRDQAGAFTASNWIHFYWIWNGVTLATLSSLTAPPTGPALPATYTHWAYAGADFYNTVPNLATLFWRGPWAIYAQPAGQQAIANGVATVEASVSITSAHVPPNALLARLSVNIVNWQATGVTFSFRLTTGVDFYALFFVWAQTIFVDVPIGNFLYLFSGTPTADGQGHQGLTANISGFYMPNGG